MFKLAELICKNAADELSVMECLETGKAMTNRLNEVGRDVPDVKFYFLV